MVNFVLQNPQVPEILQPGIYVDKPELNFDKGDADRQGLSTVIKP